MVYYKDETVKTNRLVMGLSFPQLGGVQPGHPCTGDLVRLGKEGGGDDWEVAWGKEGVEEYETAKYSNATNNDAPDNEKFEIKAEGEAEIIIISPNSMDEEDKDSTNCDDDATKSDVFNEENFKINIEAEGTENPNFRGWFVTFATGHSGL